MSNTSEKMLQQFTALSLRIFANAAAEDACVSARGSGNSQRAAILEYAAAEAEYQQMLKNPDGKFDNSVFTKAQQNLFREFAALFFAYAVTMDYRVCPHCGGKAFAYDLRETDHECCTVECGSCDHSVVGPTPETTKLTWNVFS